MISKDKFNKRKDKSKINRYYIAYGSNMDLDQMSYRVKDSIYIGTGYLEDYKLEFKSRYATIREEDSFKVPVVIFGISEEDERLLDRYEGYPELYYKKEVEIILNDSLEKLKCMVYIMEKNYDKYQIPEVSYYLNMEKSYKIFKFDIDILENALIESYKNTDNRYNIKNTSDTYRLEIIDLEYNKAISSYESSDIDNLIKLIHECIEKEVIISGKLEGYIFEGEEILYFSQEGKIYKVEKDYNLNYEDIDYDEDYDD